ncbi:efflux transporter outer membrane subunit [Sphingomonas sp. BGYR3]|uniref:efflux transporter outer membrane subunit n=1 Tax=Sphingomonas sp. BGYR3 TaxID=2975483 RepID=UPI0021A9400B|nr:efflux transporter outer membrane subunit [Sphingomonas sp. BGYR3]MDG5489097.1 efflux transporter outer membrane subunit [Sphingomonas sp. BGYR3]
MLVRRFLFTLAVAAPLGACSVGPQYRPASGAALGLPDGYSVGTAPAATPVDLTQWWTQFDDPLLTELVGSAATTNLDVAQSLTRLRQAREQLVTSRAALLPSVSASGSGSRNEPLVGGTRTTTLPDGTIIESGGGSTNFSVGGDARYQIDLFGGNAANVRATLAQYQASGYDLAGVLIAVQGEIARNYVQARLAQLQLANARESLGIQDENLEIAGFRVQAGLVSSLDVEQARISRAQTAASIPQIEASYNAAVSRLGVLTGQAPGALKSRMEAVRPIPTGPARIAAGIPADTLRQRPDVRSAERNLAAATAQIGVARAQLFPALSIGGTIDSNANAIGSLFNVVNGRLFSSIAQTIFDGGRLRAQARSAEAAADGAFLAYKSSVLVALEDIENAIVALDSANRREAEFQQALTASTNAAILARSQYRAGLTDFTTLNQTENSLLSAANSLAQARADKATALVQLYGALGGGWNPDTPVQAIDTATPAAQTRND